MQFYKETKFEKVELNGRIVEIPEDWEVVRLGDVAEIKRGASPRPKGDPRYFGGDSPWIKISDVSKYKVGLFLLKTEECVTEEGKKRSVFVPDDTLVASNSGTIGVPAIVKTGKGGCIHDGIIAIFPKSKKSIEKIYLYYYFEFIQPILQSKAQKGTQGNLNTSIWKSIELLLPPLEEQKKIAHVLRTIDNAIEIVEKAIEKLERIKKATMEQLLTKGIGHREFKKVELDGRTIEIPKSWRVVKLGNIADIKGRIGWHGLRDEDYLSSGDYYLVRGIDFENGKIVWDRCVCISKEWYERDPNIQLREGDILITKDGTIGKIALVDSLPKKATLGTGIFRIRLKKEDISPRFIYYILESSYFKIFMQILKAGSTLSHLYQKDIVKFSFPLPPLEEQKQIAKILKTIDEAIELKKKKKEKLESMKKAVMDKLLTGKIRIK